MKEETQNGGWVQINIAWPSDRKDGSRAGQLDNAWCHTKTDREIESRQTDKTCTDREKDLRQQDMA